MKRISKKKYSVKKQHTLTCGPVGVRGRWAGWRGLGCADLGLTSWLSDCSLTHKHIGYTNNFNSRTLFYKHTEVSGSFYAEYTHLLVRCIRLSIRSLSSFLFSGAVAPTAAALHANIAERYTAENTKSNTNFRRFTHWCSWNKKVISQWAEKNITSNFHHWLTVQFAHQKCAALLLASQKWVYVAFADLYDCESIWDIKYKNDTQRFVNLWW